MTTTVATGGPLQRALMEKYLHSRGSALRRRGQFDNAVEMLRAALAIKDQPHTRYELSQAYCGMGNLNAAFEEISRAIIQNKRIPDYYHVRREILLMMGDDEAARTDEARAVSLDPQYSRIAKIRNASQAVGEAFWDGPKGRPLNSSDVGDRGLREAIDDYERLRQTFGLDPENTTCVVPCPGYCCYFQEETIIHGLSIGPWKLNAIRQFLREGGLEEKCFLRSMVIPPRDCIAELIPLHHMVKEGGNAVVYFPARQKNPLSQDLLRFVPRDRQYGNLIWINRRAKPCAFLKNRRCMIHDVGGDPALPPCKEFLCMTGFVFAVLHHLRVLDRGRISSVSFGVLNSVAIEGLFLLAEIFGPNSVTGKRRAYLGKLLRQALGRYREGNEDQAREMAAGYWPEREKYTVRYDHDRLRLCSLLESLFNAPQLV